MADRHAAVLKFTETWARAANVTSRHERDYFVEALRQHQRERDAKEDISGKRSESDRKK
jgi:hypothetical protein